MSESTSEGSDQIDLKKYLFLLINNWKWLTLSLIACLSIAYIINRYTIPTYLVKASILIDEGNTGINSAIMEDLNLTSEGAKIDNELAILSSYSLSKEVVDSLNLYISYYLIGQVRNKELDPAEVPFTVKLLSKESTLNQTEIHINLNNQGLELKFDDSSELVQAAFNDSINYSGMTLVFESDLTKDISLESRSYFIEIQPIESTTKRLQNQLSIQPLSRGSSILEISMVAANVTKAKSIINVLMAVYMDRELRLKNQTAIKTIEFIDDQLKVIESSLGRAEDNMQDFRSKNEILDIGQEGTAVYARLRELEREAAMIELELSYYEYLFDYLQTNNPVDGIISPSTSGIRDALLINKISELSTLRTQLDLLNNNATENYPRVGNLKEQIFNLSKSIRENVKNIQATSTLKLEDINAQIESVERELNALPKSERQLINIQRSFTLNDKLYMYLMERKAEAGIAKASTVITSEPIDPPLSYAKTQPKPSRTYSIAAFLGLCIPLIIILIKEFLTTTIQGLKDIENHTHLPVLSTIGYSHHSSELIMEETPRSVVAEGFRGLRSSLQYLSEKPIQTLMITSFLSGDGKTFTAINSAIMLAKTGKKTLLLGLDLRKPKIYSTFNLDNTAGVSNVLIQEKSWQEVVHHTHIPKLDFLSAGPIPPNPNELIARATFGELMNNLKDNYDAIVIDSPPIGLVSDALDITKHSDATIYVIRHHFTPKAAVPHINDLVSKSLIKNAGIIYNGVNLQDKTYGYLYNSEYYN